MDIHNPITDIYIIQLWISTNVIMDICRVIMDIHNSIMDIHNCIDINGY